MVAYLMSQGLWSFANGQSARPEYRPAVAAVTGVPARPGTPDTPYHPAIAAVSAQEEYTPTAAEYTAWDRSDDMALGNIILRLSPSLQQNFAQYTTSALLWAALVSTFDTTTTASIFKDFKEIFAIRLTADKHPAPQFDRLSAAFGRLGAATVGETSFNSVSLQIVSLLQALIAMNALPKQWEFLVPIINNTVPLDELDLTAVRGVVVNHYETEKNRGQPRVNQAQAQRITAVKRKRGNPGFQQQERRQQNQRGTGTSQSLLGTSSQQQPRQRGKRASKRGKGKQRDGNPQHTHIASVAALAPPTSCYVTAGTFTRRGLSSEVRTLRSLVGFG